MAPPTLRDIKPEIARERKIEVDIIIGIIYGIFFGEQAGGIGRCHGLCILPPD